LVEEAKNRGGAVFAVFVRGVSTYSRSEKIIWKK
jgi:hypothetical protein